MTNTTLSIPKETLTGNVRFRVRKDWLGRETMVLQVEVVVKVLDGAGEKFNSVAGWRDAKPTDVTRHSIKPIRD